MLFPLAPFDLPQAAQAGKSIARCGEADEKAKVIFDDSCCQIDGSGFPWLFENGKEENIFMEEFSLAQNISRNIKAHRSALGLSQKQLAEMTGLSLRYISYLETEAPNLSIDVLEKIARALNCSPIKMLERPSRTPRLYRALDSVVGKLRKRRSSAKRKPNRSVVK